MKVFKQWGLQRMILIDSLISGAASEVKLTEHTNVSGVNASGKTSLLRLVPLFYGERPQNLVRKSSSGHKGFARYYLPRTGSYVIFEYLSRGEPKLSVFYPLGNTPDSYRQMFIDSHYDPRYFLCEDMTSSVPASDLLARLNALNIHYYNLDSNEEYRNILLDGKGKRAARFTMVPTRVKLSKLTPLFTGMFQRSASFKDLAQIIESWALSDLEEDAQSHIANFAMPKAPLREWIDNYVAWRLLADQRDSVDELRSVVASYREGLAAVSQIYCEANHRVATLGATISGLEQKISDIDIQREEDERGFIRRINDLHCTTRQENADLAKLSAELQRLTETKKTYEKDFPVGMEQEIELLPEKQKQLRQLNNEIQLIEQQGSELRAPYEKLKHECVDALRKVESKLQDSQLKLSEDRRSDEQEERKSEDVDISRINADADAKAKQIANRLEMCAASISQIKTRLEHPIAPLDLQQKIEDATERERALLRERETLFNKRQTESHGVELAKIARDKYDQAYKTKLEDYDLLNDDLSKLLNYRDADDSSLLFYLRNNEPGWQATYGRLLREEVLMSKLLSPARSNDSNTILGLDLNLDRLPHADIEESERDLDARIEEMTSSLEATDKELKKAEGSLNKSHAEVSEAEKRLAFLNTEVYSLSDQISRQQGLLESLAKEKRNAIEVLKAELCASLEAAEHQKSLFIAERDDVAAARQQAVESRKKVCLEALEQLGHKYGARATEIQQRLSEARTKAQERVHQYEIDLDRELRKLGVDTDALRKRINDRDELQNEVQRISDLKASWDAYNAFLQREYAQFGELNVHRKEISARVQELETELKRLHERKSECLAEFDRQMKAVHAQKRGVSESVELLKMRIISACEKAGFEPIQGGGWFSATPQALVEMFSETLKQHGLFEHKIRNQVKRFADDFAHHPGTMIYSYWLQHDASTLDHLPTAEFILEYFDDGSSQRIEDNLRLDLSILHKVDIYRNHLVNFQRKIGEFDRSLRKHLTSSLQFEAISEIVPKIIFNTDELDHWSDIEGLAKAFSRWQHESPQDLPDDDFVEVLKRFVRQLPEEGVTSTQLAGQIRFAFDVVEKGVKKTIHSERDFNGVSSNAVSYIVLILLFLGFVRMQLGSSDQEIRLVWALDELSNFSSGNVHALLNLLDSHGIKLASACPDLSAADFPLFRNRYHIYEQGKKRCLVEQLPVEDMESYLSDVLAEV